MSRCRHARPIVVAFAAIVVLTACGQGQEQGAPGSPVAGTVEATGQITASLGLKSPIKVEMQADGIRIAAADEHNRGAGHFDIMIDVGCVTPGEVIPSDAEHVHVSDGVSTTSLELPPGQHTLCLQVATVEHVALDATDEMIVTVQKPAGE
ncbi:MAG: DUF4399 domain-containing protein [Actinobacteria bacterium]|nr:DUF4399 domain-containing protein [Actinomycetota bacterium]